MAILGVLLDNWCNFAVKSGGHARQPDDSVSVGGVTIDMANFKSIEVAADRQTARLGTGHTLDTLYTGLEAYNLTTAGGRSGGVGLGGYALGGGFSNISPKYGLGIDNVYEYDVSQEKKNPPHPTLSNSSPPPTLSSRRARYRHDFYGNGILIAKTHLMDSLSFPTPPTSR